MGKEFDARVSFYRQCLAKGYMDMNDETQRVKAKIIAQDLGLPIRKIDALLAKAKADYEADLAAKEKQQQEREKRLAEEKAEQARLAVKGEWVMTVYNYNEGQKSDDKKDIAVYRRPDGSVYYTVNNGKKNEGYPAFSADSYEIVYYTYNEGKIVYTGGSAGGISMGGTHTVGPSMSEHWKPSGKGQVKVQLGNEKPILTTRAKISAEVATRFRREGIYKKYVKGDEYPLMESYTMLKQDSELLAFMGQNSSRYSHYDHLSQRSVALGNMLYTLETCREMAAFLNRLCLGDYPESDAERFERIAELPEDANSSAILNAIDELKKISGYAPADALRKKLQGRYRDVLQQEQEEKELQREQEIIRQEKAQAKWKKVRPFVFGAAVLLIATVILLVKVIIPNAKYNDAMEFFDAGKYTEAIAIFEALNGYKDSAVRIDESKYNRAIVLLEEEKYEEAIAAFSELGGYKDSTAMAKEAELAKNDALYASAVALFDAGDYEGAIAAFSELGGYKDSLARVEEAKLAASYATAETHLNSGDYQKAKELFHALGNYKDSQEKMSEAERLSLIHASVGSVVTYGTYYYDSFDLTGDKIPIEWLVLKKEGNQVMLMSKYLLACKKYSLNESESWNNSYLREWLNGSFYEDAFSEKEQENISWNSLGKVYILSVDELEMYLGDYDDYRNDAKYTTTYVNKTYEKEADWWTRTPYSGDFFSGARMEVIGDLYIVQEKVSYSNGVRPVITVTID